MRARPVRPNSLVDVIAPASAFDREGFARGLEVLQQLGLRVRHRPDVFEKTGGLHAAGLYRVADDELLVVREDVGRHNAVDKVVGWALTHDLLPLTGTVLMVSGRASFELTQKALMAGIPMLAAVSAPSSLAVELAIEAGMSVVGFLRGESMVVYAGGQRVVPAQEREPVQAEGSAA